MQRFTSTCASDIWSQKSS